MITKKIEEMLEKLQAAKLDAEKFEGEKMNNAAGTRVRGVMQEIKVLAQEIRNDVTTKKNAAKENK